MNNKKHFLCSVVSLLSLSFLVACNSNKNTTSEEPKPLEIGDTVKEWRTNYDLDSLPLGLADTNSKGEIVKDFGNYDNSSLKYEVKKSSNMYLGSDLLEEPYFVEDDAKNGDIISLYVYVPTDGNISSLQLEVFPSSMNNSIKSDLLEIDSSLEQSWNRLMISFDTLETLGAIRLNYQIADGADSATFFVDNINITLGEETVKTGYEYNEESLYQAYEPYLKVGTCMSGRMLANTELRKITQHNFNSITAENEGKPEQILDQTACQELAKTDETQVLIPRVKTTVSNLWPLKKYELIYQSNNNNVAKVDNKGTIKAIKAGNATITCKREDKKNIYATFNVVVKCNHEKELIKTIKSTCTKNGTNTFECKICNAKIDSKLELKPHEYKFNISNAKTGKSKGTCKDCKKVINFNAPTFFEIYWRNEQTTEGGSYWSCLPSSNPIGSEINGWIHKINGDYDYQEMILECDNNDLIELPTDQVNGYVKLKVIGSGSVKLTVTARYNPNLKHSYDLNVGN